MKTRRSSHHLCKKIWLDTFLDFFLQASKSRKTFELLALLQEQWVALSALAWIEQMPARQGFLRGGFEEFGGGKKRKWQQVLVIPTWWCERKIVQFLSQF